MKERIFKGVWIPAEVWLDERLTMLEKGIFTKINSLDSTERGCYASNKHIADFCQCSERKVSETVSKLTEMGYLRVQAFDGRQRELRSNLQDRAEENVGQSRTDCEAESQNLLQSNIDNSRDSNTEKEREDKPSQKNNFIVPTLEEVKVYCLERKNSIDAERFYNYYSANGWMIGKSKIQDWKASVRVWESREKGGGKDGISCRKNERSSTESGVNRNTGVDWGMEC